MRYEIQYNALHAFALGGGVIAVIADSANNLQWSAETSGTWFDSTSLVIGGVALGAIVAAPCMGRAFAQYRIWSGMALLATWFVCALFSLAISMDRLATQRDDQASKRKISAMALTVQQKRLREASLKADKYCAQRKYRSRCKYWSTKRDGEAHAITLAPKHSGADALGPRVARLIAIASGNNIMIDPADVGVIVPLLAPLGLILCGLTLMAFGAAGDQVRPEFQIKAMGRSAEIDRYGRFCEKFKSQYGRNPSVNEIAGNLNMNHPRARRLKKMADA